jgi:ribosomal protein L14E/L6E/L27E
MDPLLNAMDKIAKQAMDAADARDKDILQRMEDSQEYFAERLEESEEAMRQAVFQRTAEGTAEFSFQEVKEFEKNLPEGHAVALFIGGIGPVFLEEVCSKGPLLVIFRGRAKNKKVVILQHLSQVSITMIAEKTDDPRKPIGFNVL